MTTTDAESAGSWQRGAAFVVACPVCAGQLGAAGRLAGQPACCPLCGSTFHVPDPERPDAPAPPLTAVPRHPVRQVSASDSTVTAWGPSPRPAVAAGPAAWRTTPLDLPAPSPGPAPAQQTVPAAEAATVSDANPAPALSATVPPGQKPIFPAPAVGGAAPAHPDLQFREPVITVGGNGHGKELRRLSPEERRVRRGRRNIVMLLVGVAVLLVVVLVISMQGPHGDQARPAPVTGSPR